MTQLCQPPQTGYKLKSTPRVNGSGATSVSELTLQSVFESEETPLLRYAFSLVGRRAVAEEIVQEVFLQLHEHWDDVESPRAWLFRVVRNQACKYIRDHKRETLSEANGHSSSAITAEESPGQELVHLEAVAAVREMLDELDERDRELVKLKYFGGLKYREISEETGLQIGNVGYRLHHILKELAGKLRKLGFDEPS